jgi:D-alanine-D-alanine ligase
MADKIPPSILIFGGRSDERMVSVASAQNLSRQHTFNELWFLNTQSEVFRVSTEELSKHQNPFKIPFVPIAPPFAKSLVETVELLKGKVAFLGFHGTEGEDGEIQKLFEKNKIAFTGSGSEASRVCFEKTRAKAVLAKNGLPVAAQLVLEPNDTHAEKRLSDFLTSHGKVVVKPVSNGSSIGLHIIENPASLRAALQDIGKSNADTFLAEKFISGRELTVGVAVHHGRLIPLPPSEVLLNAGHSFDYDGKYLGHGTTEITPALITDSEKAAAQDLAMKAHQLLGCYGYTRTDMIFNAEGFVYLETNTLPGVTKASFIPQQLQAAHIEMKDFVLEQLQLAVNRY